MIRLIQLNKLIACLLIYASWVTTIHAYEYDEHDHEPEACEICLVLSSTSDTATTPDCHTILLTPRQTVEYADTLRCTSHCSIAHARDPPA